MRKALFIDRDGTLVDEPDDFQLDAFEKLRLKAGVLKWLGRIASETDFELVIVTNQDGLGTESFPEEDFRPVHDLMMNIFESGGIRFADVLIDRTFESDNAPTRKPRTGMLTGYINDPEFDLSSSYVIGDRSTDVELARNLGSRSIFLSGPNFAPDGSDPDHAADSWEDIYRIVAAPARKAERTRTTSETDITVSIDLDGSGRSEIETGIHFFDHMLEQLAKHSGFDLAIRTEKFETELKGIGFCDVGEFVDEALDGPS